MSRPSNNHKTPLVLIDGDIFVYKALAVSEVTIQWDIEGHIWTKYANLEKAKDVLTDQIKAVLYEFDYDRVLIALTGIENFRVKLWDGYKGNRADTPKPTGFVQLREWLLNEQEEWPTKVYDGIEADDVLGILATKPGNEHAIMVSADKDLKTIPGRLWREGKLITISTDMANRWHLMQTLMGDTTDGYKGCPGIGEVKAEKIVSGPGDAWVNIVKTFEKAGLTAEDALLQARLSRILRWSDWDAEKKEPRLWLPQ